MSKNIFHLKPNHEFVYSYPCHTRHMKDADVLEPIVGLYCNYNAIGHLLRKYNTGGSFRAIWDQDVGDYYALRILEACWLLISQGKIEVVKE